MNRNLAIFSLLIALVAGVILGYALGRRSAGSSQSARSPNPAQNIADVFRKAAQQGGSGDTARQDCIREKLGAERYAALALNPTAAKPEDQFTILPCYQK